MRYAEDSEAGACLGGRDRLGADGSDLVLREAELLCELGGDGIAGKVAGVEQGEGVKPVDLDGAVEVVLGSVPAVSCALCV